MSITIRDYHQKDHKAVVELITTIQQDEFGLPISYADQPDLADIDKFYDVFLVATFSDQIVGTIGFKIINDFSMIRKMFVAKDFRGSQFSVAKSLLAELEGKVISLGISKIFLGTVESFKAAHRFYEKNDYAEMDISDLPLDFPIMKVDTKFYYKKLDRVAL